MNNSGCAELASFAHNLYTQASFSTRAGSFLERTKGAPTRGATLKPIRRFVRTAVEDLHQLQSDYREAYAEDLMPYYATLTDMLANLVCEMWAYIQHVEPEAENNA